MIISGLQKLTLLDYPGRLAAIVFLGGCNFRCPFCQNSSLVLTPELEPAITSDELFRFLKKRSGILDGVCVTGGEPTLTPELPWLLKNIKAAGYLVKLDTNGTSPDTLQSLMEQKLVDYVAIDIKAGRNNYRKVCGLPQRSAPQDSIALDSASLDSAPQDSVCPDSASLDSAPQDSVCPDSASLDSAPQDSVALNSVSLDSSDCLPDSFSGSSGKVTLLPGFGKGTAIHDPLLDRISRSIQLLMNGSIEYEFRTTVVRGLHTEADFADIADWISGCSQYFLQSFQDSPEILRQDHDFSAFSTDEMNHFLDIVQKKIPQARLRGI